MDSRKDGRTWRGGEETGGTFDGLPVPVYGQGIYKMVRIEEGRRDEPRRGGVCDARGWGIMGKMPMPPLGRARGCEGMDARDRLEGPDYVALSVLRPFFARRKLRAGALGYFKGALSGRGRDGRV